MKLLKLFTAIGLGLLIGLVSQNTLSRLADKPVSVVTRSNVPADTQVAKNTAFLPKTQMQNLGNANKTKRKLILEDANTVTLKGAVTNQSVAKVIFEVVQKDLKLSKNQPIYLVLDTPGGSVFAGQELIDALKAVDRKIITVTLFAASMGFQIAQNLDDRLIIDSGTFMSHRATVSGFGGQFDGEFETRYTMMKEVIDNLDLVAATRLKREYDEYKQLILNEYWVHGFNAVQQNAADEVILLTCGESMLGTETERFNALFFEVDVTFSKCPVIRGPLEVEIVKKDAAEDSSVDKEKQRQILITIDMMYNNQTQFVQEYITTGKFSEIFKQ